MNELTPRQDECLRLSATMTDKEIARALQISDNTVDKHIGAAMRKLGVNTRKAALRALGANAPYATAVIPLDADAAPDAPAAGVDSSASGGDLARRSSLYDWYAGLGRWRTPPRWLGGRLALIVAIALGVILLLGASMAVLKVVFEVVESMREWRA